MGFGGLAQLVRASASHAEGRRFESATLHHSKNTGLTNQSGVLFFPFSPYYAGQFSSLLSCFVKFPDFEIPEFRDFDIAGEILINRCKGIVTFGSRSHYFSLAQHAVVCAGNDL